MRTRAISPEGDFQRSGNKAEPTATRTNKARSPAENRKKDLKKDLWDLFWVVDSIVRALDPSGSRVHQVLFFFLKVFQAHLFFFDL